MYTEIIKNRGLLLLDSIMKLEDKTKVVASSIFILLLWTLNNGQYTLLNFKGFSRGGDALETNFRMCWSQQNRSDFKGP